MTSGPLQGRRIVATPPKQSPPQPAPPKQPVDELTAATEEVNAAFRRAELALRTFAVDGEVAVKDRQGSGFLVFGKVGAEWRLTYERLEGDGFGDRSRSTMPIASAPRWFRFAASEKLCELVNVLRHRRAAELQLARRAKQAIDAAIAPLEAPPDDSPDFGDEDIPF